MRDLNDLLAWLEYGRTSGYIAARESKAQEEHWADLLRDLLISFKMDTGIPESIFLVDLPNSE